MSPNDVADEKKPFEYYLIGFHTTIPDRLSEMHSFVLSVDFPPSVVYRLFQVHVTE